MLCSPELIVFSWMTKKSVGSSDEQFLLDAVTLIESEGLATAEVGRRLDVNAGLIRKWRSKYGKKPQAQASQIDLVC